MKRALLFLQFFILSCFLSTGLYGSEYEEVVIPSLPSGAKVMPDIFGCGVLKLKAPAPEGMANVKWESQDPYEAANEVFSLLRDSAYTVKEIYVTEMFFPCVQAYSERGVVLPPQVEVFDPAKVFSDSRLKSSIPWRRYIVKSVSPFVTVRILEKDGRAAEEQVPLNAVKGHKADAFVCAAFKVPSSELARDSVIVFKYPKDTLLSVFADGKPLKAVYDSVMGGYVIAVPSGWQSALAERSFVLKFHAVTKHPDSFEMPFVSVMASSVREKCLRAYIDTLMKSIASADRNRVNQWINMLVQYYLAVGDSDSAFALYARLFTLASDFRQASVVYKQMRGGGLLTPSSELAALESALGVPELAPEWTRVFARDILWRVYHESGTFAEAEALCMRHSDVIKNTSPELLTLVKILRLIESSLPDKAQVLVDEARTAGRQRDSDLEYIYYVLSSLAAYREELALDWDFDSVKRHFNTLLRTSSPSAVSSCIRETLERSRSMYLKTNDKALYRSSSSAYRELFAPHAAAYNEFVSSFTRLLMKEGGVSEREASLRASAMSIDAAPRVRGKGAATAEKVSFPAVSDMKLKKFSSFPFMYLKEFDASGVAGTVCEADVSLSGAYTLISSSSGVVCLKDGVFLWKRSFETYPRNPFYCKYGVYRPLFVEGKRVILREPSADGVSLCAYDLAVGKELWRSSNGAGGNGRFNTGMILSDPFEWEGMTGVVMTSGKPLRGGVSSRQSFAGEQNSRFSYELVFFDSSSGAVLSRSQVFEDEFLAANLVCVYPNMRLMNNIVNSFIPSPVVSDGVLYVCSSRGELTAFDLKHMEVVYKRRMKPDLMKYFSSAQSPVNQNFPLPPNRIVFDGVRLLVKDAASCNASIINASDGTLVREIECGRGTVLGNPDPVKGFMCLLTPEGVLELYSTADGKRVKTLKLERASRFLSGADSTDGSFLVQSGNALLLVSSGLDVIKRLALPEGFRVCAVSGNVLYGVDSSSYGVLYALGDLRVAPSPVSGSDSAPKESAPVFMSVAGAELPSRSAEHYPNAVSRNGNRFIVSSPSASYLYMLRPSGREVCVLPYSPGAFLHEGEKSFIVTNPFNYTDFRDYSSGRLLHREVYSDSIDFTYSSVAGDTVYAPGVESETQSPALFAFDITGRKEVSAYLPVPPDRVRAVLDGGLSLLVQTGVNQASFRLALYRRSGRDKRSFAFSGAAALDNANIKAELLGSEGDYSVAGFRDVYSQLYLVRHSEGSLDVIPNPVDRGSYLGGTEVEFDKAVPSFVYIGVRTKLNMSAWKIYDLSSKSYVAGFVSSVKPVSFAGRIHGVAFDKPVPTRLSGIVFDIAASKVSETSVFTDSDSIGRFGLASPGSFVFDDTLYTLFSPGNAYNTSPCSILAVTERSGRSEFRLLPKILAPNAVFAVDDGVCVFMNGVPHVLSRAAFRDLVSVRERPVTPVADELFDFVQDGLPLEWDIPNFVKCGNNLYQFKRRGRSVLRRLSSVTKKHSAAYRSAAAI